MAGIPIAAVMAVHNRKALTLTLGLMLQQTGVRATVPGVR